MAEPAEKKQEIKVVGIFGQLHQEHNTKEIQAIEHLLSKALPHLEGIAIASRFVNIGTNKVVYDWAYKHAVPTAGISVKECWKYPCRMVDDHKLIDGKFGDELEKTVEYIDAAIILTESEFNNQLAHKMKMNDKQVIDLIAEFNNMRA